MLSPSWGGLCGGGMLRDMGCQKCGVTQSQVGLISGGRIVHVYCTHLFVLKLHFYI